MQSQQQSFEQQEEQVSVRFFREIKMHLGVRSTRRIVRLVRTVLAQLRKTLTTEQANLVIRHLPDPFPLLFIANWKYDDRPEHILHLDELVDHVYQDDRRQKHSLFMSEVDTMNSVILVLSKLDKFFGIFGLNVFQYSLAQELKQAVATEEMA